MAGLTGRVDSRLKQSFQNKLALFRLTIFLYSEHLTLNKHIESLKELCRVAKEVRVYPLLSLNGEISPHRNDVISLLESLTYSISLIDISYQFQRGATQMLVVKSV